MVLTFVSCQNTPLSSVSSNIEPTETTIPTTTKTPVSTTTFSPTGTPTSVPITSAVAPLTPTPTIAEPTQSPTPHPLRIEIADGVPAEIADTFSTLITENLKNYPQPEENSTITLHFDAPQPLTTWVYAVAAPFATIADEIELDWVRNSWDWGTLSMTAETAAAFTALWGTPATPPTIVPAEELVSHLWSNWSGSSSTHPLAIVPFHQLDSRLKVLRVEGQSPVDVDFRPETYPLALSIGLNGPTEIASAIYSDWPGPTSNRDEALITRVAMTGPAGMRRAVADRMERYGINYPGEETGPVLQSVDFAHMSNENAFASDCPLPDPNDSENVCNRDEYLALMTWMGIDINEMTGNHLNDWGPQALLHTFDLYDEAGIDTFGGGRNLAHAEEHLYLSHNGNNLAFIGCNPVGPPSGWAREDYPGALPCGDYSDIVADIRQAHSEGYFVITTLQYLEDYQYVVLEEQRSVFDMLAEAGAHVVSGSHAHHPQGFAFPAGNFVHYGLGNLLADQMWSLGSRQMFIDTHLIYDGRLLNVDLWTGINEDYARVREMTPEERSELLQAVFAQSFWGIEDQN